MSIYTIFIEIIITTKKYISNDKNLRQPTPVLVTYPLWLHKRFCFTLHSEMSIIDCFRQTSRRRPHRTVSNRIELEYLCYCAKIALPSSINDPLGPLPTRCSFGICSEKLRFKDFVGKKMTCIVRFCVVSTHWASPPLRVVR